MRQEVGFGKHFLSKGLVWVAMTLGSFLWPLAENYTLSQNGRSYGAGGVEVLASDDIFYVDNNPSFLVLYEGARFVLPISLVATPSIFSAFSQIRSASGGSLSAGTTRRVPLPDGHLRRRTAAGGTRKCGR